MLKGFRLVAWLPVFAAIAAVLGCSASPNDTLDPNGPKKGEACSTPQQGCQCPTEGDVVPCGQVLQRVGDVVTCIEGKRQCTGGVWGMCLGNDTTTKSVSSNTIHGTGYGTSAQCLDDPCDPYCNMIQDTGNGLDAGSNFKSSDSGLTLVGSQPPALATCTGLTITPASQTVTITALSPIQTSPASVTYTASLTPNGCYNQPFQVAWDIDKFDRAVMASTSSTAQLTMVDPLAGTIGITGYLGTLQGNATANVVVDANETGNAPANTSGSFNGSGSVADTDLTIVYPYDQTVFPVAIGAPTVQWHNNNVAAAAIKVSLQYPIVGPNVFHWSAILPEGNETTQIPQYAWSALDEIARGNDFQISVQRLVGNTLRQSKTLTAHFSPLGLRGQIFYTQYYNGGSDVRTFKPGSPTVSNVSAYPPGQGTSCNNPCHTVSSNGTRLVTSNWYNNWGVSLINADGTTTAISATPNSTWGSDSRGFAFSAITGDGAYAVQTANWWGNSTDYPVGNDSGNHKLGTPVQIWQLGNTPGTNPIDVSGGGSWGLGSAPIMVPSFSPDGTKLLAEDGDRSLGAAWRQGLHFWKYDSNAHLFSNPTSFAKTIATNEYIRWPSFESDSRSVMFQTNPTNNDDSSYGGMLPSGFHTIPGKLYSVDSQTANTPVALAKINVGLGGSDSNLSYQPTMLPISIGGYRWSVFTTSRLYGNLLNNSGTLTTQLWVSAMDDQTSAGTDRSHPPFWLPGQTLGDNGGNRYVNERGFWVLDACKTAGNAPANACTSNEQCCGGTASPPTAVCRVDVPLATASDTVWVEDAVPAGASLGTTNESWAWLPQAPAPAFGNASSKSNLAGGEHQHYFYNATTTMAVGATDKLYAYVYLDPNTPPSEVMIQWHDSSGSWEHRAYWGANSVGWGNNGTISRRLEGALPVTGQWVRLEVNATDVGMNGLTANGMAFTLSDGVASWDHAGVVVANVDHTYVEDSLPTGAIAAADGGDGWNWVSSVPPVPFGIAAHKNSVVSGVHQHYFYSATQTLALNGGDKLFTYVWLDPNATPSEIMLQWHDTSGSWEHRAYWGGNGVPWGNDNTISRHPMGALPATGQWLRLEVPVEVVGLAGITVDGMAFTLYDGAAAWDHSGKVVQGVLSKHCAQVTPPQCIGTGGQCLADSNCCNFPGELCISGACSSPAVGVGYQASTFTRDFVSVCDTPNHVVWHFFDWETITPGDSSLVFSAQTADSTPSFATAPTVSLGTAKGAPITNWVGTDVAAQLAAHAPPLTSGTILRIKVVFNPSTNSLFAPTLVQWRAAYDCVNSL